MTERIELGLGPKTVFKINEDFSNGIETIFADQTKRDAENKTIKRTLPGKSHISRIILHDNTSQERILDMKLADIRNSQRKMEAFMTHQKKTFLKRMEKKHHNWAKEHARQATEFNSKGAKSMEDMLRLVQANPERYRPARNETPSIKEDIETVKTVLNENKEEAKVLPDINSAELSLSASHSRIPERKLKPVLTRIPTLPTLFSLPTHIASEKEDSNPFLTCDNEESGADQKLHNETAQKDTQKNKTVSNDTSLPQLSKSEGIVSSARSQTAPKSSVQRVQSHHQHNKQYRPVTEHRNKLPKYVKKIKSKTSRFPGPEPTFIAESLPRMDLSDPSVIRLESQEKMNNSKVAKRRAQARETNIREVSRNPLRDDRFMRLQNFLSPCEKEIWNMDSLSNGIVVAKRHWRNFRMKRRQIHFHVGQMSDDEGDDLDEYTSSDEG